MAVQSSKGRADQPIMPMPALAGSADPDLTARLTLAEVRQLIALMDTSDIIEITIERQGQRFALRKQIEVVAAPAAGPGMLPYTPPAPTLSAGHADASAPAVLEEPLHVVAPLVGMWFPAMRTGQKPLVAVGDLVREGQVVGAIETLRVMNEVESQVTGRVREILVKPGQPVEYGQPLMVLDPAEDGAAD